MSEYTYPDVTPVVCKRCGAVAEFYFDGTWWCDAACMEFDRRGVPAPDARTLLAQGRSTVLGLGAR